MLSTVRLYPRLNVLRAVINAAPYAVKVPKAAVSSAMSTE